MPPLDVKTLFGLASVSLCLVCYALERRGRIYVLGFAGACLMSSIYGFWQGAWPFGLVEAAWTCLALARWLCPVPSPRP